MHDLHHHLSYKLSMCSSKPSWSKQSNSDGVRPTWKEMWQRQELERGRGNCNRDRRQWTTV
eukprot:644045-Heterocapsa_arctica.AAC.1